ncbi:MAG: MMPL family transporter [Planctomycetota bacterium]|jgi:predicted exporter
MDVERAKGLRRAKLCGWMLAVLVAVSTVGWTGIRFDSSLEVLLPEGSEARKTVVFLRNANFAEKAVLWFQASDRATMEQLISAARQVESWLDPTLIKRVIHPPRESEALGEIVGLLDRAGELLSEEDLSELEKAMAPESVRRRMRQHYMQLAKPEGAFMQRIIRRDPLGVSTRILERFFTLSEAAGFRAEIRQGQFVHPDGRQLLLVLETQFPMTNTTESRRLVEHLQSLCAQVPPEIQVTPICGHTHTAMNYQSLRRDIQRTSYVAAAGFIFVFLGVYRDWRAGAVFLIPIVSIGVAIGLSALVQPNLSIMVIGLAATMAGIAVDYGIHVYATVRTETEPFAAARRIVRPLATGMVTTLGVFVAFLFARIPAYRQLGMMAGGSLILSLLIALFVLPAIIRPARMVLMKRDIPLRRWGEITVGVALAGCVLLITVVVLACGVRFDFELTRLDGAGAEVLQAEQGFQQTWRQGARDMAILAATGATRAEAETRGDRLYRLLVDRFPDGQFVSLSGFWPSDATRQANLTRWKAFWSPERIAQLRSLLEDAGAQYDFSADAFEPFFQNLNGATHGPPKTDGVLAAFEQPFVVHANGEWQMLSYFPDTTENVAEVRDLLHDEPEAQIVSRRALGQALGEAAASESRLLMWISAAFILVSNLVIMRHWGDTALSLLPAGAGLAVTLALSATTSLTLNLASIIAVIAVIGLCVDHGAFVVHAWNGSAATLLNGVASVHLAAWTTLIGAGSLLFAQHPALFTVGVTLFTGVLAGYLTTILILPGVCHLRDQWRSRGGT